MSPEFAGGVIGLILGGVLGWLAREEMVRGLRLALLEAVKQERIATDRLVHAWKEGAKVAPRPTEEAPPLEPLPQSLQEELDQWEDGEHRAMLEAQMRAGIAKGKDPVRILLELDQLHP